MSLAMFMNSLGNPTSETLPEPNLRYAFFNIWSYNGTAGSAQQAAIDEHITRVNADLIGLSEVNTTIANDFINGRASALGYNYVVRGIVGTFSGQLFLSKYPLSEMQIFTSAYVNSFSSATNSPNEMLMYGTGINKISAQFGAKKIIFYSCHLTTFGTPGDARRFIKNIELKRLVEDAVLQKQADPNVVVLIGGDMNEYLTNGVQEVSFSSVPSGVPGSYSLGNDISLPIPYATMPATWPDQNGITTQVNNANLAGSNVTIWGQGNPNPGSPNAQQIDFLMIDNQITVVGTEVVDSEVTQTGGLLKYGAVLPFASGRLASDHKMIFADVKI